MIIRVRWIKLSLAKGRGDDHEVCDDDHDDDEGLFFKFGIDELFVLQYRCREDFRK